MKIAKIQEKNKTKNELKYTYTVNGVVSPKIYCTNSILDFGKFKGIEITSLLTSHIEYLKWCIDYYLPFIPSLKLLEKLNMEHIHQMYCLCDDDLALKKDIANHKHLKKLHLDKLHNLYVSIHEKIIKEESKLFI